MLNSSDRSVYDARWEWAIGTKDESILSLDRPKNQASFFYTYYNRLLLRILEEQLGPLGTDTKVLEIGCGRATASIFLAITRGCMVMPTDYSANAVKIANKNMINYNLPPTAEQADIFEMKKSKDFDAVISLGVMEHMPDQVAAYEAMLGQLKPGGIMISMNVPDKDFCIQTLFIPVNRVLRAVRKGLGKPDNRPWLDSKSRSNTGSVYRTTTTASGFRMSCVKAGFIDTYIVEYNPFPTIDSLPTNVEELLVRLYEMIIVIRKWFGKRCIDPFETTSLLSRCHFIVGKAP